MKDIRIIEAVLENRIDTWYRIRIEPERFLVYKIDTVTRKETEVLHFTGKDYIDFFDIVQKFRDE